MREFCCLPPALEACLPSSDCPCLTSGSRANANGLHNGCDVQMAPALAAFGPLASGNSLEQGFHSAAVYRLHTPAQTATGMVAPPPPPPPGSY